MRYTDSHEWIRMEGNVGTVGITAHAQKELGEIVFVELPEVGSTIKAGEEVSILESTKAAADVYAPVTGTITAINPLLQKNPQLLNQEPESKGWLFQVEIADPKELEKLLTFSEYQGMVC